MFFHAFVISVAVAWFVYSETNLLPYVGIFSFGILFLLNSIKNRSLNFLLEAANLVSIARLVGLFFILFNYKYFDAWLIALIAFAIIIADGVDGYLARRFSTVSRFGSYLDMETDALFVMGFATILFDLCLFDYWVFGIGLIRYFYFPIIYFAKPVQKSEERNFTAQTIAVLVMISLPACLILPSHIHQPLVVFAAILLAYSFGNGFLKEMKATYTT